MGKPKIRKAVFPVAGVGRRLWPATKSIPKEMLTIVDRPLIDYAVEEAKAAGIEQFIFVTRAGSGKQTIQDYFNDYHFVYLNQPEPAGLGHAIWCARHVIGDEPFAVILPDDLFLCSEPCLSQLINTYDKEDSSIIAVTEDIPKEKLKNYGIVAYSNSDDRLFKIDDIVEKPETGTEPSNIGVVGRYILEPEILNYLENQKPGSGGEIQLTDAIRSMIKDGYDYRALKFEGSRYDCGDKVGFVRANLAIANDRGLTV